MGVGVREKAEEHSKTFDASVSRQERFCVMTRDEKRIRGMRKMRVYIGNCTGKLLLHFSSLFLSLEGSPWRGKATRGFAACGWVLSRADSGQGSTRHWDTSRERVHRRVKLDLLSPTDTVESQRNATWSKVAGTRERLERIHSCPYRDENTTRVRHQIYQPCQTQLCTLI